MSVNSATHKLYQFNYSICSIMVRYTYAIRGEAKDAHHEIRLTEQDINIMQGDQLTEHYLCDINAAGEVLYLQKRQNGHCLIVTGACDRHHR